MKKIKGNIINLIKESKMSANNDFLKKHIKKQSHSLIFVLIKCLLTFIISIVTLLTTLMTGLAIFLSNQNYNLTSISHKINHNLNKKFYPNYILEFNDIIAEKFNIDKFTFPIIIHDIKIINKENNAIILKAKKIEIIFIPKAILTGTFYPYVKTISDNVMYVHLNTIDNIKNINNNNLLNETIQNLSKSFMNNIIKFNFLHDDINLNNITFKFNKNDDDILSEDFKISIISSKSSIVDIKTLNNNEKNIFKTLINQKFNDNNANKIISLYNRIYKSFNKKFNNVLYHSSVVKYLNYNINIKGVCLIEGQKIDRCLLNISNVPLSIFNNFDIINDYFQTSGVVNGTFATEFDSKIGLKNGKIYINLGDDVEIKPKFFSENIMVKSINIEANVQNNFELIENIKINFKDDFGLNIDMIGNNIKFYNNQIVDGKLKLSVNELDANKFLVMLKEEYKDKLIFKNFTLKNGLISILTDVNFLNDNNKKQNISIIHNQYKYNILLKLRDAMFVNQKYNIEINNTDIDFVLEKNIVKLNLLNADIFNNHIANLNIINNTLLKKLTINFDNLLLNTKFIKNINHFIFNEKQQEILNKYFYNLYINGEISISNKADNLHCIASNLTLIGNKDLKKNNYIYNVNINKDSKQKNGFINLNIFSEDKKLFNQQKFSFNINNESFDNKNHIIFSIAPETLDTIFGGKIIFQSDLEYLNSTLNINFNNNKIYFQNLNNITNVDIKINKIKLEKWMLKMLNFLTENNSDKELTNFNINIKSFELLDDNFMNNIKCNGMLFNHLEFHGECLFDLYDKKINKITSNLISNKNGEIKVHIDDMSSIINLLYNTKYNVFNIKSDGNFNNNEHLSNLNLVINSTYHNELDAIKQNPIIRAKAKLTIKNGNQVKIENGLIEKKLYKYTVKGVLDFDNNVNHDSNTDLYLKNNKKQNDKNFLTGKIKINTPISTIQDYFASDYDYNSIFNSGNSDYYAGGKNITDMMKNLNIKSKGMLSILEFIFGKVRV